MYPHAVQSSSSSSSLSISPFPQPPPLSLSTVFLPNDNNKGNFNNKVNNSNIVEMTPSSYSSLLFSFNQINFFVLRNNSNSG
jgi:hypothetical protein